MSRYVESVAHDMGNGVVLFVARTTVTPDRNGLHVYTYELTVDAVTTAKGETMSTSSLLKVAAALPVSIGVGMTP
jgi:hypothetical protein